MNQHTCALPDPWYSVQGEYFDCGECKRLWVLEDDKYADSPEWIEVFRETTPKPRDTTPIDIGYMVATVVGRE
jgi:hypothetical protein